MPTEVTQNERKRQREREAQNGVIVESVSQTNGSANLNSSTNSGINNGTNNSGSAVNGGAQDGSSNFNSSTTSNGVINSGNVSNANADTSNLNNQNGSVNSGNSNVQNSGNASNADNSSGAVSNSANGNATVSNSPNLATNLESIKERLDEIDKDYNSRYPVADESIYGNYQYQDVTIPSENVIREQAENDLTSYRDSGLAEINNDYNADIAELDIKQNEVENDLNSTRTELADELNYGVAENQAQNISQGIANSSIAANTERRFRASIDAELETALNKANTEMAEIALKRGIAENEFQLAIENFDIAYANKLENRISELNKEYQNKQAQALEYNEKIQKQREAIYNEWRVWAESYTSQLEAEKGRDKAYYIIDQLKGLSKAEALEIVSDTDIVAALGNWYTPVIDYIERVLK